jgi:hypothetical protein
MQGIRFKLSTRVNTSFRLFTVPTSRQALIAQPASPPYPGESVRWRKLRRNWLGPGEGPLFLIALTDECTGRTLARLARENSVEENLEGLREYVTAFGRPLRVRTERSTLFGPQIRRALGDLEIEWVPTESPCEPGLSTLFLETAWENLPRELSAAGVRNLAEAVRYLESIYLSRWNGPASAPAPSDRHRPLPGERDLESICCVVLPRKVFEARLIRLDRTQYIVRGMPDTVASGEILVERRVGGELTARWNGKPVTLTPVDEESAPLVPTNKRQTSMRRKTGAVNRKWMNGFFAHPTLPIWKLYR